MLKTAGFHIIYDGPALQENEMDVRDLSPPLIALSDAIEEANLILNRGRTKIVLNVKASFKTGCFGVDLSVIQDWSGTILNLFKDDNVVAAVTILNTLGLTVASGTTGFVKVLKWLRGRKVKSVKKILDGKREIVVDNDRLITEKEVIALLESYRLRESIEKAIAVPLDKEGIDSVTTTENPEDKNALVVIKKNERTFFMTPPREDEEIEDKVYETNLQIIGPVFQEGNKWRFTEGAGSFHAEIQDNIFISDVQKGKISFTNGDVLKVRLHKRQYLKNGKLNTDFVVVKVLRHRTSVQQIKLPFDDR